MPTICFPFGDLSYYPHGAPLFCRQDRSAACPASRPAFWGRMVYFRLRFCRSRCVNPQDGIFAAAGWHGTVALHARPEQLATWICLSAALLMLRKLRFCQIQVTISTTMLQMNILVYRNRAALRLHSGKFSVVLRGCSLPSRHYRSSQGQGRMPAHVLLASPA